MKNIIIALLLAVSLPAISQTTQEEYNYITKGYKTQVESGLDMKKGYSFKDYGTFTIEEGKEKRQCEFKGLFRDGQTKPCAVMMIFRRTDISNGAVHYICIPSSDAPEDIWKQTNKLVKDAESGVSSGMYRAFVYGLMKFGALMAAK
ncbi:MAG: hypothetical protein F9K23_17010 [Bacteroidetes bacterium]|nr:MAG: hypothetical protein F9K23_17010 [Bacteroidota bacterium]